MIPIRWQCPLAVSSKTYTKKSDVYSFGIVLFEIFSRGLVPYADLMVGELIEQVKSGHRLRRPSSTTSEGIVMLIRECTQMIEAKRPNMGVILSWLTMAVDQVGVRSNFQNTGSTATFIFSNETTRRTSTTELIGNFDDGGEEEDGEVNL